MNLDLINFFFSLYNFLFVSGHSINIINCVLWTGACWRRCDEYKWCYFHLYNTNDIFQRHGSCYGEFHITFYPLKISAVDSESLI